MLALEVQWLKELVDQEQWDQALKVAGQLIVRGGYTGVEYAEINYAICRSKAHCQELHEAIPSGELCRRLCLDSGEWDLLGKVLLVLGVIYIRIRSYQRALATLNEYFEHAPRYLTVGKLAGRVWHNIGNALVRLGQFDEAVRALNQAREAYRLTEDDVVLYHQVTQLLVDCCLEVNLSAIPSLLSELRTNALHHSEVRDSRPRYFFARARYAYRLGAYRWAASLCLAGLLEPNKYGWTEVHLNLMLSKCLAAIGHCKDALGYALAGRMAAIQKRAFDLEFIAIEAMYDLMSKHGTALLHSLDQDYLQQGLDMMPLVGGSAISERRYS